MAINRSACFLMRDSGKNHFPSLQTEELFHLLPRVLGRFISFGNVTEAFSKASSRSPSEQKNLCSTQGWMQSQFEGQSWLLPQTSSYCWGTWGYKCPLFQCGGSLSWTEGGQSLLSPPATICPYGLLNCERLSINVLYGKHRKNPSDMVFHVLLSALKWGWMAYGSWTTCSF